MPRPSPNVARPGATVLDRTLMGGLGERAHLCLRDAQARAIDYARTLDVRRGRNRLESKRVASLRWILEPVPTAPLSLRDDEAFDDYARALTIRNTSAGGL